MFSKRLYLSSLFALTSVSSMLFMGVASAQNSQANTQQVRIQAPVDETSLVTLKGNTHPLAQPRFDRGPVPVSMPTGRILLVLQRSAAQDVALKSYLASLQSSTSSNFHHWLTPAEFGATYGIGDADLQTVEQWLQSHGFKVEKVAQGRNAIQFSGTVSQLQSAFHTSIHSYQVNGASHYANTNDPQIPAALAPVIQSVGPLNDFHPTPLNKPTTPAIYDASTKSIKPQFTLFNGTTPVLYTDPADAATIYDTPNSALNPSYTGTTYDGTGVNIGIAGDSNLSLADVTNYRVAFLGETASTANIPTVVIDGNDPGINGDEAEALLDNEIAGGLAPKAKIYFYASSDTDLQSGLFDAVFRAIDDNTVSILNISFGACEANLGTAGNAGILEGFEQAAAQGISVVVSSGDSGSAGCDSSGEAAAQYGLAVNGIASTPYTIAVGGTDYDVLGKSFSTYVESANSGNPPYYLTALGYIPEQPWNDSTSVNNMLANNVPLLLQGSTNVVAAGGGASIVYPKPSFQTALTPADSARDLPDVSFLAANGLYGAAWVVCGDSAAYGADCQTANGTFIDGARFSGYGGTSTAAPAFAGMLALIEQKTGSRLGQANYVLYQLASSKYASVFHDVTTGNNSVYCSGGTTDCGNNSFMTGYDAGVGYDQASGLGSVDVANLVANWSSVALAGTTTTLSIDGSTAPLNVVHGTSLTFSVGVNPATSGAAAIIDTANEVAGGPLNNGQIPVTITSGTGTTIYNGMPGGTYTVYASYGGDTANAASTSTPAINVTITPEASTSALQVSAYNPTTGTTIPGGLTAIPYGSQIFLDAAIYGTAEGMGGIVGVATGTVSFSNGSTVLGQSNVSDSNSASYPAINGGTFPAFSIGTHSLTAAYSGDPSYNASTSAPVGITIVQNTSSIISSASSTSIPSSATTTLTITVEAPGLGVGPTGSVTLTANGATLATLTGLVAAPAGGVPAQSRVKYAVAGTQLIAGNNTITVTYSGDTNYMGSTGTIVINVLPSRFTLHNSGALTFQAGATTGNTATITAAPINSFVGAINLTCAVTGPTSATSPATCTVPSSIDITSSSAVTATLTVATTTSTTPGAYGVTVTGTNAATGTITVSSTVNVTVTAPPPNPAIALSNSGNITIAPGATTGNTSTITITPSGAFTGSVALSCAVTTTMAAPNDPPTCSIPVTVNVTGTTAVTATVTVSSTAPTSAALHNPFIRFYVPATGSVLAFVIFFGIPRRRGRLLQLASLLSLAVFGVLGCGGSGSSNPGNAGTSAGSYIVTVTATGTGVTAQTTTVNVTVN